MNDKKIIDNLFFKKKENTKNKSTSQGSDSTATMGKTTTQSNAVLKNGKYDTTLLRQQVSQTDYISNLRIGRSWVLPQLVKMGFQTKGLSRKFDMQFLESNIRLTYDLSQAGRCKIWTLLKRNYKAIAMSDGQSTRTRWWTKALLVEMMVWDFGMVGKRRRGLDRSGCKNILETIVNQTDSKEIYDAVVKYDTYRMRRRKMDGYRFTGHSKPLPDIFIDAFMGDGAYNAMMTMVKIFGIRIKGDDGIVLTRDESIAEIDHQAAVLNGHDLMKYCKETFFDSGAFEYKKYVKQ